MQKRSHTQPSTDSDIRLTPAVKFECICCGTCCSRVDLLVTVTGPDIVLLASGLRLGAKDMLKVLDFYVLGKDKAIPAGLKRTSAVKTEAGMSYVALKKTTDGKCIFLENNLCSIYPLRPVSCRSFPFFFSTRDGDLTWGLSGMSHICPGIGRGPPPELQSLAVLAQNAVESHSLYAEFAHEWNSSVHSPTAERLISAILSDFRFRTYALAESIDGKY